MSDERKGWQRFIESYRRFEVAPEDLPGYKAPTPKPPPVAKTEPIKRKKKK